MSEKSETSEVAGPERTRTLTLLRHAKAHSSARTDKLRPLSDKGRRQAGALGPLMRDALGEVDLALVSGALRTQQTAEYLGAQFEIGRLVVTDALYDAHLTDLLELVWEAPEEARSILVVGHEPTISQTARYLHDAPDDALGLDVRLGVSTATACVLDAPAWAEVDQGRCHLRELLRP